MDFNIIKQAFESGGWNMVFCVLVVTLGKWFLQRKLAQDAETAAKALELQKRYHEERIRADRAFHELLACVADSMAALVYKQLDNKESATIFADLTRTRLEAVRTAERVASQTQQ